MKKQTYNLLMSITGIFIAFLLGFYLGRNGTQDPVILSNAQAIPTTTAAAVSAIAVPTETAAATQPSAPAETQLPQTLPTTAPTEPSVSDGLVHVNTATLAELMTLPGIGEVIGQRIIDYREASGPFTSAVQLTNVSGIGQKRLEAIIDLISVE